MQVGTVRPADVERWVVGLHDRGLSPATVSRALRYLRDILGAAVRDRLIPSNPADTGLLRLPATSRPRPRDSMTVLTASQVVAVVEATDPY